MKLQLVGFDPSLTHWGIASSVYDTETDTLTVPEVSVIIPDDLTKKTVRTNSRDLYKAQQLAKGAFKAAEGAKFIFVEVPVGSQSARAMASYGVCVGILAALQNAGHPLVLVTATEVKRSVTGHPNATKLEMINGVLELVPEIAFPRNGGKVSVGKSEHMADAVGAILAGLETPEFKQTLQILR